MIESFVCVWNEEVRLPWYLEHYGRFVDRMFVYDQFSTDRTAEIAKSHPKVVYATYGSKHLDDIDLIQIKNQCWKGSSADWVIVSDCDELVFGVEQSIAEVAIERPSPNVLCPSIAYDALFRDTPASYKEATLGCHAPSYEKFYLFCPRDLSEINYLPGAHVAEPSGAQFRVARPAELTCLHYHFIGLSWTLQRYRELNERRSRRNHRMRLSYHYAFTDAQVEARFEAEFARAVNISTLVR